MCKELTEKKKHFVSDRPVVRKYNFISNAILVQRTLIHSLYTDMYVHAGRQASRQHALGWPSIDFLTYLKKKLSPFGSSYCEMIAFLISKQEFYYSALVFPVFFYYSYASYCLWL